MQHRHRQRITVRLRRSVTWLTIVATLTSSLTGCSRRFWRQQAERDTYSAVVEKLNDERWKVPRIDRTPDPRSRFFDPYDPDCEPLPPDDPAAHRLMHCMDGKRGYKSWHKLGQSFSVENPHWLQPFGIQLDGAAACDPSVAHSVVNIEDATLPDTLELSAIHSRDYQTAIEDLYLRALELTLERFRFGVRYLAGAREPGSNFFLNFRPDQGGHEADLDSARFGMSQLLPSGATWVIELTNNTIWLFGNDAGGSASTASSLSYSLVQPLMLGAGRKVVLESLTQQERDVLYSARSLARFRKQFFVDTTAAYLNILQQMQTLINERGNISRLDEQLEIRQALDSQRPEQLRETLEAWPDGVEIPESLVGSLLYNANDRTLRWNGAITPAQRDAMLALSDDPAYQQAAQELAQRLETDVVTLDMLQLLSQQNRSSNAVLRAERTVRDAEDVLKLQVGLPPNIGMTVDTSLLKQFELIDPNVLALETDIRHFVDDFTDVTEQNLDYVRLQQMVTGLRILTDRLQGEAFQTVEKDFGPIDALLNTTSSDWQASPERTRGFGSAAERQRVANDVRIDHRNFEIGVDAHNYINAHLTVLEQLTSAENAENAFQSLGVDADGTLDPEKLPDAWEPAFRAKVDLDDDDRISQSEFLRAILIVAGDLREEMLSVAQGMQVVQIGLRVETIALNPFHLPGTSREPTIDEVVQVGLANRLDLMNERAIVMDARRGVEIAANALEAGLDLRIDGALNNKGDTPFDFHGSSSNYRVGVEFKTPADLVDERNRYNAALIDYQRARRDYMAFEDTVKRSIRDSWRQVTTLKQQLEFDRQSVRRSATQYDNTSISVFQPVQAGARGGQTGLNLLNALRDVLTSQNSLVGNWFSYERNRLNLFRDMGIMEIDELGVWQDDFYQSLRNQQFPENTLNEVPENDTPSEPLPGEIPPAPDDAAVAPSETGTTWRLDDVDPDPGDHHRRGGGHGDPVDAGENPESDRRNRLAGLFGFRNGSR